MRMRVTMEPEMTFEPTKPMDDCCNSVDAEALPCPQCEYTGPVVGVGPVRPHLLAAVVGDWQYCTNLKCQVVYYLGSEVVDSASVGTRVGLKATDKPTPVCFCFAHTRAELVEDLRAHGGVSEIKAEIKAAVADGQCACEHLNPSGKCCLVDVQRALKSFTRPVR